MEKKKTFTVRVWNTKKNTITPIEIPKGSHGLHNEIENEKGILMEFPIMGLFFKGGADTKRFYPKPKNSNSKEKK